MQRSDTLLVIIFGIVMTGAAIGVVYDSKHSKPSAPNQYVEYAKGYKQGVKDERLLWSIQEDHDQKRLKDAGLCVYAEKVCYANSISGRAEHRRFTPKAH